LFKRQHLDRQLAAEVVSNQANVQAGHSAATDPAFWQKGLSVISGMIDELE
jgi:hypothetical protein